MDPLYDNLNTLLNNELETIHDYSPMEDYLDISMSSSIRNYVDITSPSEFVVEDQDNNIRKAFVKYITLVDYVKYLVGKYKDQNTEVLPCKKEEYDGTFEKNISQHYNYAYVDTMFYYASSQLMKKFPNFVNGIQCFDTFIAMKQDCRVNIADDFEYLSDSTFMIDNMNKKFVFEHSEINNLIMDTRKDKISIEEDVFVEIEELDLGSDEEGEKEEEEDDSDDQIELSYEDKTATTEKTTSTTDSDDSDLVFSDDEADASKSVDQNDDEMEEERDEAEAEEEDEMTFEEEEEDSDSLSIESDDTDIDELYLIFKKFPVQVAVIEKCENTLDKLLEVNDKKVIHETLQSAIAQTIITLYIYQNMYDFTHNDLHTNNIMYVNTEKEYLYYKIMGRMYKIPTYGKIYKIIDFGRALYKINGKIVENDSFSSNGTAFTQYNYGSFKDENKMNIEPNKSFDLTRLSCSLYDFICEDVSSHEKAMKTPLYNMILNWVHDDHGKNVLYRADTGEERYPGFKLYKMIARHVHNHTPENQFQHEFWKSLQINSTDAIDGLCDVDEMIQKGIQI